MGIAGGRTAAHMNRTAAWLMTLSDDMFLPTCQYSVKICTSRGFVRTSHDINAVPCNSSVKYWQRQRNVVDTTVHSNVLGQFTLDVVRSLVAHTDTLPCMFAACQCTPFSSQELATAQRREDPDFSCYCSSGQRTRPRYKGTSRDG